MREIPKVTMTEIEGYAKVIAKGWDTIKESFNVQIKEDRFDDLRKQQAKCQENGDKSGAMIEFGGEILTLSPYGTKSAIIVLYNDDFRIFIRSPKMDWCVSIEYSAAGLWEYGIDVLRDRAIECLTREFRPVPYKESPSNDLNDPRTWQRVSAAHFAFDFHSEEFTKDMTCGILEGIVCPSPVKKSTDFTIKGSAFGRGAYLETITIGRKNSLQVQIYDKGKEITEASGKTWMFSLWEREGYVIPQDRKAKDVWRFEARFGCDFLRDRGILVIEELKESISALLTEAIFTRRLTVQSVKDNNRWRWPLHPLYVAAYKELGEDMFMLPLGRQVTMSDIARAERMKKTIAGNIRSLTVLSIGDMDEQSATRLVKEAYDLMISDPDGERKTEQARVRYFFTREAA